jgi:Zinc knuckle
MRPSVDYPQPGHFVRDCPTRHAVGDTGGRKPKEGYVCRACGSEGHLLEDCLVANQRPPQGDHRGGRRGPPKEIGRKLLTHFRLLSIIQRLFLLQRMNAGSAYQTQTSRRNFLHPPSLYAHFDSEENISLLPLAPSAI